MNTQRLRETVRALQSQMAEAGEIDAETQALLQTVNDEVKRILTSGTETSAADNSIAERLRETLIEFEVRHPHVGGLLERITDGLASMGI